MKNTNMIKKVSGFKLLIYITIILFVCISCSESTSNIVMIPIGEGDDLIIISTTTEAKIFFPSSYGSISNVMLTAEYKDRPFFDLWKKYAAAPNDVKLLNYNTIQKTEDTVVTSGSSSYYRRKFDDKYIMEVDLSENFKDFLTTNCENCIMVSLIKTLLTNESVLPPERGSIHLTVVGKPLVTQNQDYTAPITINSLDQLCNHTSS